MIVFNELRITDDGTKLIVRARVRQEDIYNNVYITGIKLGSGETYTEGDIGGVTRMLDTPAKSIDITITNYEIALQTSIDFKKDLIFIEVITTGDPTIDCCCEDKGNIGVTLYMHNIYSNFLNMIREMGNTCSIPDNFINSFLEYKALETAIDSKHYTKGIEYYNKWFKNNNTLAITGGCGCNG